MATEGYKLSEHLGRGNRYEKAAADAYYYGAINGDIELFSLSDRLAKAISKYPYDSESFYREVASLTDEINKKIADIKERERKSSESFVLKVDGVVVSFENTNLIQVNFSPGNHKYSTKDVISLFSLVYGDYRIYEAIMTIVKKILVALDISMEEDFYNSDTYSSGDQRYVYSNNHGTKVVINSHKHIRRDEFHRLYGLTASFIFEDWSEQVVDVQVIWNLLKSEALKLGECQEK